MRVDTHEIRMEEHGIGKFTVKQSGTGEYRIPNVILIEAASFKKTKVKKTRADSRRGEIDILKYATAKIASYQVRIGKVD